MELKDYSDEVALIDTAKQDPAAFGLLYSRYVERIYRYVYFRVGGVSDAEDITSKVFVRAYQNLKRYRHLGLPFSAWLYRIAHNQVANFHRDRGRYREIAIDDMNLPDGGSWQRLPETVAVSNEETDLLMRMVNDLPEQRRELIMFKFIHKLSNEEIAKVLDKTEGAIKSLYHRTLLELRDRMKNYG